jgi:hypothetical protein
MRAGRTFSCKEEQVGYVNVLLCVSILCVRWVCHGNVRMATQVTTMTHHRVAVAPRVSHMQCAESTGGVIEAASLDESLNVSALWCIDHHAG